MPAAPPTCPLAPSLIAHCGRGILFLSAAFDIVVPDRAVTSLRAEFRRPGRNARSHGPAAPVLQPPIGSRARAMLRRPG